MHVKTVRASEKGQLTLPKDIFLALGGAQDLLLVQEGDHVILMPAEQEGRRILHDLGGWEALGSAAFEDVWDNEDDEVWNDA